jgi:hypothetical protein
MTATVSMPSTDPLALVLSRLGKAKRSGKGWSVHCPAHEDRTPSLSVSAGDDRRVLLKCHAGCTTDAIVRAIGLELHDLHAEPPISRTAPPPRTTASKQEADWALVATYPYVSADGHLLYEVQRKERPNAAGGKPDKKFVQRRPSAQGGWEYVLGDVQRVLYGLPDVIQAVAEERRIYIVEGEKNVHDLAALGLSATTNAMGARQWRPEYSETLRGAHVVILPDNDQNGRAHADLVAASLAGIAADVRRVELPGLPPKGDVSDWIRNGGTREQLEQLLAAIPGRMHGPEARRYYRLDELLADEEVMRPPPPVVPRLAWQRRSSMWSAREKRGGKSTKAGFVAARVSKGEAYLGEPCQQGNVLLVGLEEFIGDAARRLKAFDADKERVFLVDRVPDDIGSRVAFLRDLIGEIGPTLVIIDSLIAWQKGAVKDSGSAAQNSPIVQGLTDIAHETGVALVILHHAKKSDDGYRDSSAIGAAVDVIVEISTPNGKADPSLRHASVMGRVAGARDFDFRFTGDGYELVTTDEAPLELKVLDFVRANPGASLKAVRDAMGGSHHNVDRALGSLVQRKLIIDGWKGGKRDPHSYRLPDASLGVNPARQWVGQGEEQTDLLHGRAVNPSGQRVGQANGNVGPNPDDGDNAHGPPLRSSGARQSPITEGQAGSSADDDGDLFL